MVIFRNFRQYGTKPMVLSSPTVLNRPRLEAPMVMVGAQRGTVTEVTEALGHSTSQS